jgi:hypothetical protein
VTTEEVASVYYSSMKEGGGLWNIDMDSINFVGLYNNK